MRWMNILFSTVRVPKNLHDIKHNNTFQKAILKRVMKILHFRGARNLDQPTKYGPSIIDK